MRKVLLASAAVAALLAGPALAQNAPDKSDKMDKPGMSAQQNEPKAGAADKAKDMKKQTTGQSAQQPEGKPAAAPESKKGMSQGAQSTEPKAGPGESKRSTTGQSSSEKPMQAQPEKSMKGDKAGQKGTAGEKGSTTGQSPSEKPMQAQPEKSMKGDKAGQKGTAGEKSMAPQQGTSTQSTQQGTTGTAAVSQEQQTKFNQVIEKQKVQSVTNVNFSVAVGSTVPSSVRFYDVPADIVSINREFRGKKFVLVRDEIIIIEPRTRKIVSVIPRSGRTTTGVTTSTSSSRLQLAPEKRRMIRETVIKEQAAPRCADLQVSVGATVPRSLQLRPLPDVIVREVPEIRSFDFCLKGNEVVLIDPNEYRIVEIID